MTEGQLGVIVQLTCLDAGAVVAERQLRRGSLSHGKFKLVSDHEWIVRIRLIPDAQKQSQSSVHERSAGQEGRLLCAAPGRIISSRLYS